MFERSFPMSDHVKCQKSASAFGAEVTQRSLFPQKGQRGMYENEEAEIVSIAPLFVIRTKDRVVCGDIEERFECI
jgi:hypothetical protein